MRRTVKELVSVVQRGGEGGRHAVVEESNGEGKERM